VPLWVGNKFARGRGERAPGSLEAVCGCEMSQDCNRPDAGLWAPVGHMGSLSTHELKRIGT